MTFWDTICHSIRNRIDTEGIENFWRWPEVAQTMNIGRPNYFSFETKLCQSHKYYNLLDKDDGGWEYANLIHQLCHIISFETITQTPITKFDSVVEVGGGMGCMRKLVHLIHPNCDYTIIDLPVIQEIQKYYLREIPTTFLSQTDSKERDLLISTWAITEIEDLELREQLLKLSSRFLIAGQSKWKSIDNVKWLMDRISNFKHSPINHLGVGNFYLFR